MKRIVLDFKLAHCKPVVFVRNLLSFVFVVTVEITPVAQNFPLRKNKEQTKKH
jgi:hypothetical protein